MTFDEPAQPAQPQPQMVVIAPAERPQTAGLGAFALIVALVAIIGFFGLAFSVQFADPERFPFVVARVALIVAASAALVALVFGLIGLSQSRGRAMAGFAIGAGLLVLLWLALEITQVMVAGADFLTAFEAAFGF